MMKRFLAGLGPVLVIVLAIFLITNGLGNILAGHGEKSDIAWGLMELGPGVLLLAGLFLTRRSPRLGTGLIIVTVAVAAGLHFWMAFITFPIALLVTATMLVRIRTPRVAPAVP